MVWKFRRHCPIGGSRPQASRIFSQWPAWLPVKPINCAGNLSGVGEAAERIDLPTDGVVAGSIHEGLWHLA
jgi:hypothetical protein